MGGLFRFLWYFFIAYLAIRIIRRLIGFSSGQKKGGFNYTDRSSREEGDVVIERTAPQKTKNKVQDESDFVDYEEVD